MKKIISILLIACCVLALAACGKNNGLPDLTNLSTVDDYATAVNNTNPTTVKVNVTYENTAPAAILEGEYNVTYNVDGTATIKYKQEKLNAIGEGEGMERVEEGTVEVGINGELSGSIDSVAVIAATKKLNLKAASYDYTIGMDVLNATVKAKDTEAVFGVNLRSDAILIMRITSEGKVGSYSVSYSTPEGKASIVCIYD